MVILFQSIDFHSFFLLLFWMKNKLSSNLQNYACSLFYLDMKAIFRLMFYIHSKCFNITSKKGFLRRYSLSGNPGTPTKLYSLSYLTVGPVPRREVTPRNIFVLRLVVDTPSTFALFSCLSRLTPIGENNQICRSLSMASSLKQIRELPSLKWATR